MKNKIIHKLVNRCIEKEDFDGWRWKLVLRLAPGYSMHCKIKWALRRIEDDL